VRLNKTLLLLTKIDNHQFPESVDVDIVDIVKECVASYGEVYELREICFEQDLPQQYVVHINESLASTLVSNLIRNVYIHAPEGSQAKVEICDGVLTVSNDGDKPLDADHVFDRFYKARHGKKHSNGLGLSIVKAICDASGLGIRYAFEGKKHIFTVSLT
jgi:signal transduction histidine kinase